METLSESVAMNSPEDNFIIVTSVFGKVTFFTVAEDFVSMLGYLSWHQFLPLTDYNLGQRYLANYFFLLSLSVKKGSWLKLAFIDSFLNSTVMIDVKRFNTM